MMQFKWQPRAQVVVLLMIVLSAAFTKITELKAQTLSFFSESVPSRSFIDPKSGEVTGWASEAVLKMAEMADISAKTVIAPWARSYQAVRTDPNSCIYLITRTSEREESFHWVGPLMTTDWTFFAKSSSNIIAHSMADIEHLSIGVYRNDVRHSYLEKEGYKNLLVMPERKLGPNLLFSGRIDLWFDSYYGIDSLVAKKRKHQITPVLTVQRPSLWLGCNRQIDQKVAIRLSKAATKLHKDGYIARLRDEFENNAPLTQ